MSENRFLVVIETQRVKGYVFASPILRETRGASLLLDTLNRTTTQKLLEKHFPDAKVIYLGGGSGRVLFTYEKDAHAFAEQVRTLYREQTGNARISVEVLERQSLDGKDESFPAWVSRGVRESQQNKLARVEAIPMLAGRWIRPCSACGQEPAEHIPLPDVQGTHYLCYSCLYKREAVSAFYHDIKRNWDLDVPLPGLGKLLRERPNFILTTLVEGVQRRFGAHIHTLLPTDFNKIAQASIPSNYIGFIYADGNRMGETIKAMGTNFPSDTEATQAYQAFSAIVDQATREAAVRAVLKYVPTQQRETPRGESARFIPAEFVLAGGDDLILVVPAHTALHVASHFITFFQKRTRQLQTIWQRQKHLSGPFAPQGLTTSAGVVLAHASYPASQLMDLAGELMKFAKRQAADLAKPSKGKTADPSQQGKLQGTLDFIVLHTPGSEKIKHRRQTEYIQREPTRGLTVKRTERPYTARQLMVLLRQVQALKATDVPRTKLKELYAVLFQGTLRAQFDAQHIRERLQTTGALQDGPLQELIASLPLFPFRSVIQGEWSTPLSELIELYDFVRPTAVALSER